MTLAPSGPLFAAGHVQNMATRSGNERIGFILTGLSCLLVAKMVWDTFGLTGREKLTHRQKVNLERVGNQLYGPELGR